MLNRKLYITPTLLLLITFVASGNETGNYTVFRGYPNGGITSLSMGITEVSVIA